MAMNQDPFYLIRQEIQDSVSLYLPWPLPAAGQPGTLTLKSSINVLLLLCLPWQVHELSQTMSRFHGLSASNPERKKVADTVEQGCNSVAWQVREIRHHQFLLLLSDALMLFIARREGQMAYMSGGLVTV